MDHGEVSYESNYTSFNSILAQEESEMMLQWFGSHYLDQNAQNQIQSLLNPNSFLPPLSYEGFENVIPMLNYYTSEEQNIASYQLPVRLDMQYTNQTSESNVAGREKLGQNNGKRKLDACIYDENDETFKNVTKKRSRPSLMRKRKNEEGKEGGNGESSSCNSDDESNSNGELNTSDNSIKNSNGKSNNVRGTATDPQSLYARKRREKINMRLKTLQSLVPNGTKVDISTMLEEAVHYVKFLQLQIKLLSNDELWMYAPIAYNGINFNSI